MAERLTPPRLMYETSAGVGMLVVLSRRAVAAFASLGPPSGLVLDFPSSPDLGHLKIGHSQEANERRKIRRHGKIDGVADFEIDFGEDLGLGRWRPHAREKGSVSSHPLPVAIGHDSLLFVGAIQHRFIARFNYWRSTVERDYSSGRYRIGASRH
jgi:hypothetical protein